MLRLAPSRMPHRPDAFCLRSGHAEAFCAGAMRASFWMAWAAAANPNVPVTNVAEPNPESQLRRMGSLGLVELRFAQMPPEASGNTGSSDEHTQSIPNRFSSRGKP